MRNHVLFFIALLFYIVHVHANVEKVIFLGPKPGPEIVASWEALQSSSLELLSPTNSSLRRVLQSSFASSGSLIESEAWILLDALEEGRRYEVRICWSATQPTSFDLSIHDLDFALKTPELLSRLQAYLDGRQATNTAATELQTGLDGTQSSAERPIGKLLLHVRANADYFTTNHKLMTDGLLVDADIILDPFLFNTLPQSLIPTGVYLLLLACTSWFLSEYIYTALASIGRNHSFLMSTDKKEE